ncbi:MAG: hypothetical protein AB8E82_03705 [Aureispira sp.]
MTRSTSFAQFVFCLFTLIALTFDVGAYITQGITAPGGPRGVIQEHTGGPIEITQPVEEHLDVIVEDENGNIVTIITTDDAVSTISTAGWTAGEYTVKTIDENAVYQEDVIDVE